MADIRVDLPSTVKATDLYAFHDKVQPALTGGLWAASGAGAQSHVLDGKRKLPKALVVREGIGYMPEGRNGFVKMLKGLSLSLETGVAAGLLKRDEKKAAKTFAKRRGAPPSNTAELSAFFRDTCAEDSFYYRDYHMIIPDRPDGQDGPVDALHGDWLTIPIRIPTPGGVKIGGWQLRSNRQTAQIGKQGRYRNPVNTIGMTWNQTLIGLGDDGPLQDKEGHTIVCEGYFDRLAVVAALESRGPRTSAVLALGGIAVRGRTDDAIGVLGKVTAPKVSLLLDNDGPGLDAVLKVGPLWAQRGQFVNVCAVPDGWAGDIADCPKDVGELFEKGGSEAVTKALVAGRKRGLVSFASAKIARQRATDPIGGSSRRLIESLDVLLPLLESSPESTRAAAIGRAAETIGLATDELTQLVTDHMQRAAAAAQQKAAAASATAGAQTARAATARPTA